MDYLTLYPPRLYALPFFRSLLEEMIRQNVRAPEAVMGDIMGQLVACRMGEKGILAMVRQYGVETLKLYFEELRDYSERVTRQKISEWPDGVYEYTDYIDEDGLDPDPIPIRATVHVHGDSLDVDFSGSAPQVRGAINCALSQTVAATYVGVRSAMAVDIPNNQGCFRPIKVTAPEGTITNMRHPAPCAARGVTGFRIADAVRPAREARPPDASASSNRTAEPRSFTTTSTGLEERCPPRMVPAGLPAWPATCPTSA